MRKYKGWFITFEGIEGCGKTTQAAMLADALKGKGFDVILTREPGGPPVSEAIRKILLDPVYSEMLPETEMLLYMASRSQHTGQIIIPALKEGKIVISDRYYDSTIAYQGAARNLDLSIIETITAFATFNTDPDLTILLDLPVEAGRARIQERKLDRLEQETIGFHQKVRAEYLNLAEKYASRYRVIKAERPMEDVRADILTCVLKLMESDKA